MKELIPFAGAALLLLLLHSAAPQNFKSVLHSRISDEAAQGTRTVGRPCECREHCAGNCTGVSISTAPPASYACAYTQRATSLPSFRALLTSDSNSTAYFRDHGHCMENFTHVEGVGCLILSRENTTHTNASCPLGSSLFTGNTIASFNKTRRYLLRSKKSAAEDFPTDIWVGLTKSPTNRSLWEWATFGTINDQPSPYWGAGEPTDGQSCARMRYDLKANHTYHLAVSPCTTPYSYLCKQV